MQSSQVPVILSIISISVTTIGLVIGAFLALRKAPIEQQNMKSQAMSNTAQTVASLTSTVNQLLATVAQLREAQEAPQDYTIAVTFRSTLPPTLKNSEIFLAKLEVPNGK
jgi:uncharacterized protein YpmS